KTAHGSRGGSWATRSPSASMDPADPPMTATSHALEVGSALTFSIFALAPRYRARTLCRCTGMGRARASWRWTWRPTLPALRLPAGEGAALGSVPLVREEDAARD